MSQIDEGIAELSANLYWACMKYDASLKDHQSDDHVAIYPCCGEAVGDPHDEMKHLPDVDNVCISSC